MVRKAEVQTGAVYMARVSGRVVPVRIVGESVYGGWAAVSLLTGRRVHIRGAQRLRRRVEAPAEARGKSGKEARNENEA